MELNAILSGTFFENVDPRRKQERNDARMIQENHSKMANLSENAIHREFNAWDRVERLNMFDQSKR